MTAPPKPPQASTLLHNLVRVFLLVWAAAPGTFVLNLIVTLGGALVPVGLLYVTKLVVDAIVALVSARATLEADISHIWLLVAAAFGLTFAQGFFSHAGSYFSQGLSDRFSLHANKVLLAHATKLDLAHFEDARFHDALQRAQNDGSQYPVRVLGTLTSLAGQLVSFASLVTLLFRFDALLMGLLLATSLPVFWVGVRFSGRRFWMVRTQTQSGRLADYFRRVLSDASYVKEVRLFGLGPHLLNAWGGIRARFNAESEALQVKHSSARFGIGLVGTAGYFGAYGLVVSRAARGVISVGDLTLYAGAFQQAQSALQNLLLNVASLYEYNLYVSQYFEFLALEPSVVDTPNAVPFPFPLARGIEFRGVTFTYAGASKPALNNVSFSVGAGESVALVGVNGSGKTTLLKLLARFYDPQDGEIFVDGIPLRTIEIASLRRAIGVIFQDFARWSLDARSNVGFGDLAAMGDSGRVEDAAKRAGADEVVRALPNGYDTVLGKTFDGGVDLSGGQWQKIGLARAFMAPAPILVLDEPTAAVDALAEFDLFKRFQDLTRGKTTFLVSHRFSTVRLAERILVFEQGRLVEEGTHAALVTQGGLYQTMFTLQAASYQ